MNKQIFSFPISAFAALIGAGAGFLVCTGIQSALNAATVKNCSTKIYVIAYSKTAVGDTAHCVSIIRIHGPSVPLKD